MTRTHKHLIAKWEVDYLPHEEEVDGIKKFITELVETIDMKLAQIPNHSNPISWYCKDKGNEGMTIVAVITTSHIALHFWEDTMELQFDLYSCKDFDADKVFEVVDSWFRINETKHIQIIER